ncbi:glycosyltransferase [Photobacterium leiognathi]|uniref:glycosyltransferase n=1 Tax=Photobacterium leiognathi TaxID=553611 RepID=UPI0029826526|nr:glycosyltransferase [Photobacterium leiognathi]
MKKILFITHNLKGGGIQKITLDTARYYSKNGYNVNILTFEKGLDFNIDFTCQHSTLSLVNFLFKNPHFGFYYIIYKLILRYLLPDSEPLWQAPIYKKMLINFLKDKEEFEAIFINGSRSMNRLYSLNLPNMVFSLHLPCRYALKDNIYYNYIFKKIFSNVKVFTVSNFILQPILNKAKRLNVDIKAIETIYNPCDKITFNLKGNESIDISEPFILAVGRLCSQKRFDLLIDAYKQSNIKTKLVILGEGNQRDNLEKQISQLHLSDQILLKGFDCNPYKWMKKCQFFVLSSDIEGFVLVINEALACGAPVIATDCGPVTEILVGKLKNGIVPKGDVTALSSKIIEYSERPIYPDNDSVDKLSFASITKSQLMLAKK